MHLKQLQEEFAKAAYKQENAIAKQLTHTSISHAARLKIYQDNCFMVLHQTLVNVFPAVQALVGGEFFKTMSYHYAQKHPSLSGNLDGYGETFASFLGTVEALHNFPYVEDMVHLEWARHLAYMAADATPMDVAALSKLSLDDYETMTLVLHPSVSLIRSRYPLDQLWELATEHNNEQQEVSLEKRGVDMVVVRPQFSIEHVILTKHEADFLASIASGATLIEALEAINSPSFDGSNALQRFISQGIVTDYAS